MTKRDELTNLTARFERDELNINEYKAALKQLYPSAKNHIQAAISRKLGRLEAT
jgi:hypothetical protein